MSNTVEHPDYYNSESGLEVFDIIDCYKLGFYLGNTVKYICRAGKKDPSKKIEDLKKAEFYIKTEIEEGNELECGTLGWGSVSYEDIKEAFGLDGLLYQAMENILNSRKSIEDIKTRFLFNAKQNLHDCIECLEDLEKTK